MVRTVAGSFLMAALDWGQALTIALGSGVTAGIVNNLAGGIRDVLVRKGAAKAAATERDEARKVRHEKANEEARDKMLLAAILTRNWIEQEIWDRTEDEDGRPVHVVSVQDQVSDVSGAADAISTVSLHHPSAPVRRAARVFAARLEEERYAIAAGQHESEHATIETYRAWLVEVDELIDAIHDVRNTAD